MTTALLSDYGEEAGQEMFILQSTNQSEQRIENARKTKDLVPIINHNQNKLAGGEGVTEGPSLNNHNIQDEILVVVKNGRLKSLTVLLN